MPWKANRGLLKTIWDHFKLLQIMENLAAVRVQPGQTMPRCRHRNHGFVMKLSALLITCLCGAGQILVADSTKAQKMDTRTITLELHNEQLDKALDKIERL